MNAQKIPVLFAQNRSSILYSLLRVMLSTNDLTSRIYNEDCLQGMAKYPDKFFDLAVVDPPYGINAPNMSMGTNLNRRISSKGIITAPSISTAKRLKGRLNTGSGKLKNRILNKSNIDWDMQPPSQAYFDELFRVSKNQIIWGGNYFPLRPTRCILCWDKKQPWDNFSQWEMAWTSFDKPAALFRYSTTGGANNQKKIHPTEKPVALYDWIFKKFAEPGMRVIDTHLGSGNSRISADRFGVDFTGFEISKQYLDDHITRWNRYKSQLRFEGM